VRVEVSPDAKSAPPKPFRVREDEITRVPSSAPMSTQRADIRRTNVSEAPKSGWREEFKEFKALGRGLWILGLVIAPFMVLMLIDAATGKDAPWKACYILVILPGLLIVGIVYLVRRRIRE